LTQPPRGWSHLSRKRLSLGPIESPCGYRRPKNLFRSPRVWWDHPHRVDVKPADQSRYLAPFMYKYCSKVITARFDSSRPVVYCLKGHVPAQLLQTSLSICKSVLVDTHCVFHSVIKRKDSCPSFAFQLCNIPIKRSETDGDKDRRQGPDGTNGTFSNKEAGRQHGPRGHVSGLAPGQRICDCWLYYWRAQDWPRNKWRSELSEWFQGSVKRHHAMM
jgi:hypothetical protein